MANPDISVIVLTYNADLNDLKKTLRSIMLQKGVSYEIVIADDGSSDNLSDEISAFFETSGFEDYVLAMSPENHGTVVNVISGVEKASGRYVKLISPGDYLYDEDSLRKLFDCAVKNDAPLVFGDILIFDSNAEEFTVIKKWAYPQIVKCYSEDSYDPEAVRLNNLVVADNVHGVSTLIEHVVLLKYLKMIEGKVIYCEDLSYRLMAYEGVKMIRCPYPVVMYGYGEGISTSGKWEERLRNDTRAANEMMLSMPCSDEKFKELMRQAFEERFSGDRKKMKAFFAKHPDLLLKKLKMERSPRYTATEYNEAFVSQILGA